MAEVSVFKPLAFTKLGLMLEAKLRTGVTLQLTRVKIGDGTLSEDESPLNITELKHEITSHQTGTEGSGAKVDMSNFKVLEAGITDLRVIVESNDSDFVLREMAIMAKDPDAGEIPYLYTYGGTDAFKNGVTVRRTYDFTDIITNATDIKVNTTIVDGTPLEDFEEHKNNTNNPHEVNAKQVGLENVTNESKETMFTSPTFTGTPTAPTAAKGTRNKQIATTEFVTEAIENMMSDVLNAIKDLNDDKQGMVYAVALAKSEAFDDCADLNNYKITYSEYQSHTEEKEIEKFKYTTEMTSQIPNLPKYCFVFVYTTASKSGDESEVENRQYMLLPNGKFYTRVRTIWTQSGGDSEGSWGAWNELTYSDTATDTMKNNILTIPVRS